MVIMKLPAELVLKIFSYLDAKDLIASSGVCQFWHNIVEELCGGNDEFWWTHCKKDYKDVYKSARVKSRRDLTWFNIYKCLTLWPKVELAKDKIINFAIATSEHEKINDFTILGDDTIGIHKRSEITYYNTNNFELSQPKIVGSYVSYAENKHLTLVLSLDNVMYLSKKFVYSKSEHSNIYCRDVKLYIISDSDVYYVKTNNAVYLCDMSEIHLSECHLFTPEDIIISLDYSNDKLYVLSSEFNIICYNPQYERIVPVPVLLTSDPLKILYYDFVKNLNWSMYNQWLFCNDSSMPLSVLEDASTVLVYGNIFAVGTYIGQFYLYHFTNEINSANIKLLRKWNLRSAGETCPILKIDIVEMEDGHQMFLATPHKIVIIELLHD